MADLPVICYGHSVVGRIGLVQVQLETMVTKGIAAEGLIMEEAAYSESVSSEVVSPGLASGA